MKEVKTNIYDMFRCIAGDCPMTCCKGWAIRADGGIYDKWKENEETAYLCENVTCKREDDEDIYHMKADNTKTCVMLDCNGLCEIVKRHGDECLSDTCANFPRKKNHVVNEDAESLLDEYSLSGGCPAVIDLIWKNMKEQQYMIDKVDVPAMDETLPMEYRIRNAVINIIQRDDFKLTDKLLLGFSLLLECLECEWEDNVYDCIQVYEEKENLTELVELYHHMNVSDDEAFQEICQTFFDVSEYYKEEAMYRPYLYRLADYVQELYPDNEDDDTIQRQDEECEDWQEFKSDFEQYDKFFEKILVSEIFADCVSDDLGYLIEAYQAVVLEYIMTRLSVFLSRKENYESIRNYISLFIRVIGHNTEGMAEYWEENFEDTILEKDYFYMLLQ